MTGTLPRRATAPATRSEERIAGLAEEAARRDPAVSDPVATVRVDGVAVRVDLDLVVAHGAPLAAVAEAVRRRVAARVGAHTGLTVEAVTVTVVGLRLPGEPAGLRAGRGGPARETT
ncbi:Asp23/Gls24 family envelope stress response protein [Micromonospora terminaliae]|uniref:Asp23/Gls24 family envelope stress response protein n=1 Tax=Micromonospora terminaliae TaxID=1914461 RepID=A0AAJ2ZCT1_9ACTN|nr:Asp23/Gls24 family envelope stress response protein [Micromonospora terminaliae]NES27360.1 Asp23/Gls24 family envelope stress response protein [Micromonospora terminaliae]QGL47894.1 Asp23/Gls24 family envelope stress response protein [Micromonospora terminaliae]